VKELEIRNSIAFSAHRENRAPETNIGGGEEEITNAATRVRGEGEDGHSNVFCWPGSLQEVEKLLVELHVVWGERKNSSAVKKKSGPGGNTRGGHWAEWTHAGV